REVEVDRQWPDGGQGAEEDDQRTGGASIVLTHASSLRPRPPPPASRHFCAHSSFLCRLVIPVPTRQRCAEPTILAVTGFAVASSRPRAGDPEVVTQERCHRCRRRAAPARDGRCRRSERIPKRSVRRTWQKSFR